jgi:hypothetical protein
MTPAPDSMDFAPNSAEERKYLKQMRQTRICIWVILLGLVNFLAFAVGYWILWGEAVHGYVSVVGDGLVYHLYSGREVIQVGYEAPEVSRGAFLYSGIHSISIWLTVGAVLLAMLTLAKERIVSSASRAILRGRTLITVVATIITVSIVLVTVEVTVEFIHALRHPIPAVQTPILDDIDG